MKRYTTILADPPWRFADRGTRLAPDYEGEQRKAGAHYPTMSIDDLTFHVGSYVLNRAADDAFLFLWAPHAIVLEGTARIVALSWGFVPKQEIVWIKTTATGAPRIGGGHYTRICTEPMLLCTRGKAAQLVKSHSIPNVIYAPRTRHSAKPDESYELIERLAPGPYLELFARRRYSKQWDVWGNEV